MTLYSNTENTNALIARVATCVLAQLVPPIFFHQVSFSRPQFSLARPFFSARLFLFGTIFCFPLYLVTLPQGYLVTLFPCYLVPLLPCYLLSCYSVSLLPCYLVTLFSCYSHCYLVILLPCYSVTLLLWNSVTLLPCYTLTLMTICRRYILVCVRRQRGSSYW